MLFYRFQGNAQALCDLGLRYLVQLVHDEYCLAARRQSGNGGNQLVQCLRGIDLALLWCCTAGYFRELGQCNDHVAPPALATTMRNRIVMGDLA
ncbi:hypothetical protein D3C76_1258280 [compost metagenome]